MTPTELLARLESLTGPDRKVDFALTLLAVKNDKLDVSALAHADELTDSVDAALDFKDALLPGRCTRMMEYPRGNFTAQIMAFSVWMLTANAPTLPLAICIATLKAFIEKEKEHGC